MLIRAEFVSTMKREEAKLRVCSFVLGWVAEWWCATLRSVSLSDVISFVDYNPRRRMGNVVVLNGCTGGRRKSVREQEEAGGHGQVVGGRVDIFTVVVEGGNGVCFCLHFIPFLMVPF